MIEGGIGRLGKWGIGRLGKWGIGGTCLTAVRWEIGKLGDWDDGLWVFGGFSYRLKSHTHPATALVPGNKWVIYQFEKNIDIRKKRDGNFIECIF